MIDRDRYRRGFTLVELLVAITLLGLIAVALSGVVRFGNRAWEAAEENGNRIGRIETVQELLRRQLGQAVIPANLDGSMIEMPTFVGDAGSLRFVALLPPYLGAGGYYVFDIRAFDGEDGRQVQLAWHLYRGADGLAAVDGEQAQGRVLLRDIDEMWFSYFGAENPVDEPRWMDRWEETDRLPRAVAIYVTFPEGDQRLWPPMVAAPVAAEIPQ